MLIQPDDPCCSNEPDAQSILRKISDVLLINGGFLSNPGLYDGEMGLVLFFARYVHYTKNELYSDYAYGLIEKIRKRIDKNTPINYRQGLAGIGSTIEIWYKMDSSKLIRTKYWMILTSGYFLLTTCLICC
jgi:hypothetical protein